MFFLHRQDHAIFGYKYGKRFGDDHQSRSQANKTRLFPPFIPTEEAPTATACSAYSICTNLPDGLNQRKHQDRMSISEIPSSLRSLYFPPECSQAEAVSFGHGSTIVESTIARRTLLTSPAHVFPKGTEMSLYSHAYSPCTMAGDSRSSPSGLFLREVTDQFFVNISIKGYEKKVGAGFKEEFYAFHVVAM